MKVFMAGLVFMLVLGCGSYLYAETKEVTLTTYFPNPKADYKDLRPSQRIIFPTKSVDGKEKDVREGEIWVES